MRVLGGGSTAVLVAVVFAVAAPAAGAFEAGGSVRQVYATGIEAGQRVTLTDGRGKVVRARAANPLGGVLFRGVRPGAGYTVRAGSETSDPLTVLTAADAPPDTSVYHQTLRPDDYQYLTTRDGTQLAIDVHPPTDLAAALPGVKVPDLPVGAPTPTLIEYSGYGYANPDGPDNGIAVVANLMGFTVVDVNMRGTGCSGGAFDFFEPLQGLDGYDVIETVARQPWVKHGKVGMMGISYGGISQLFTARHQPPGLAAIAPLSTIDNTQTTLYPGGILNTGFAVAWAKERQDQAKPATAAEDEGQRWAYKRIQEGDQTCARNQALHADANDLMAKIRANRTYQPKVADPLSPVTFVDEIDVPTFLVCQWQDEQTGGHCPTLPARFTGTDRKWFTFTNGTHIDSLGPQTFNRWYDFLKLYVAREAPAIDSARIRALAPVIYQSAMGIDGVTLPDDPIQREPTYEAALAAFERLKPVRVLFENGGGGDPGKPYPRSEASFDAFPVPGTRGRSFFLGDDGRLLDRPARRARADRFTWDPKARPFNDFEGSTGTGENGLWTTTPGYRWEQPAASNAASYVSAPLAADTTVVGSGFARLWVRSATRDVDLQATVSEVRPDGQEMFVQSGWLKTSMRALDKRKSTRLSPVLSLRKRTQKPLARGRFTRLTVPLYYQGHPYRTGSRIRVTVSAVNGDQPIWGFGEARPKRPTTVDVGHGGKRRSVLTLPVVPGVQVPPGLPPCPLRGQPCRPVAP